MGMIDSFRPQDNFSCPVCGKVLYDWQSHDSEGLLLFWQEWNRNPLDTELPDECIGDKTEFLNAYTLPAEFMIYSYDCDCPYPTALLCHCDNGLWNRTEMYTGSTEDMQFAGQERKADYKMRMKWLDKELLP
ncbi:MAG: hypothetical protein V7739_05170 [Motiliproteus sp.]